MKTVTLIVLTALFSLACGSGIMDIDMDGEDIFSYHSYNTAGEKIASGFIDFSIADTARIEGCWTLFKKTESGNIGPQHGKGTLTGRIRQNTLILDLHPEHKDNNIILTAPYNDENMFQGEWKWITYAGISNQGTFKLTKIVRD